jgi:myo-inositol-hexaphosphate 3-phosphohydrolase
LRFGGVLALLLGAALVGGSESARPASASDANAVVDAPFAWIDPAAGGTPLPLADNGSAVVALPFGFEYYGTAYTSLTVSANGYVVFGSGAATEHISAPIPSAAVPNGFAAPFWDDLDPGSGGGVWHATVGSAPDRKFVVGWIDVPHAAGGDATFEAVLEEGMNAIVFQYRDVDFGDVSTFSPTVAPFAETPPPTVGTGDDADDPAVHASGYVIGTNKNTNGGLEVYDATGTPVQSLPLGRTNNVDLRGDVVVSSNRTLRTVDVLAFTSNRLELTRRFPVPFDPYGIGMFKDTVIVTDNDSGTVHQYDLDGNLLAVLIGPASTAEGVLGLDGLGIAYVGEENQGVWRFAAGADGRTLQPGGTLVIRVGENGLVADVEGLAYAHGHLIVSSQGNSTFKIYRNETFVHTFTVAAGNGIDQASETDGIEANEALDLLVVHDHSNDGGTSSNYKYVRLSALFGTGCDAACAAAHNDGASATVGVEDHAGAAGEQFLHREPLLAGYPNAKALRFTFGNSTPQTTITSGPSGTVTSTTATFEFSSSEEDSTFACSLDGSDFADCTSPATYSGLAEGTHTFRVRAAGAGGTVDPTPAERTWTIAGSSCARSGTTLTVALDDGSAASIGRSGSSIVVNGIGLADPTCGGATVSNVDTIDVAGAGGDEAVTIDLAGGALSPGATGESSGTSEIELTLALGAGADRLTVLGSASADKLRLGSTGVGLNGDSDGDVTTSGVESFRVAAAAGNDTVTAAGGNGTGTALTAPATIEGGVGTDTLTGGLAADAFIGGDGTDTVLYAGSAAVTVTLDDLANDGAVGEGDNVGADVERVTTGSGNDSIAGSAAGNLLKAADGADVLTGGFGKDTLEGGGGNDQLGARDGVADTVRCGPGVDTVTADTVDSVSSDCESVSRA